MNTIQPYIQTRYNNNTKINFKSLKGIKYEGNFKPNKYIEDIKTVQALKKSETFKEFFKQYDGIVEFLKCKSFFNEKNKDYAFLTIRYKKASPKKTRASENLQNIKKDLSKEEYSKEISYHTTAENEEKAVVKLRKIIKNLSKTELAEDIKE